MAQPWSAQGTVMAFCEALPSDILQGCHAPAWEVFHGRASKRAWAFWVLSSASVPFGTGEFFLLAEQGSYGSDPGQAQGWEEWAWLGDAGAGMSQMQEAAASSWDSQFSLSIPPSFQVSTSISKFLIILSWLALYYRHITNCFKLSQFIFTAEKCFKPKFTCQVFLFFNFFCISHFSINKPFHELLRSLRLQPYRAFVPNVIFIPFTDEIRLVQLKCGTVGWQPPSISHVHVLSYGLTSDIQGIYI